LEVVFYLTSIQIEIRVSKNSICMAKKLSKSWQEFIDAWIAYLTETNDINKVRLHTALENFLIGGNPDAQEEWIEETKKIIEDVAAGDRDAWRMIFNFIKEYFPEETIYHDIILDIAKTKKIGNGTWVL
jgi:hypothetical protein